MWGNLNLVMPDKKWHFRKSISIEQTSFNDVLRRFSIEGVDSIVRENIQNTLDNRLEKYNEPVKVVIKTGDIECDKLPGISEVQKHISSLIASNEYADTIVKRMQTTMYNEKVAYISFEDFNAKGLTGAFRGEKAREDDTWNMYAYKKGMHHFDNNSSVESTKCGYLGVGKIANNSASDIHMMYFSNCDENGSKYIGGTVELIDHEMAGHKYSSTGYFAKVDNDKCFPYVNEFDSIFRKDTRGLKIVVPFLKKEYNDESAIIRAVCDNFFVAILTNILEVSVNNIDINKKTIVDLVVDESVYSNEEELIGNFTNLYLDSYINNESKEFIIKDDELKEIEYEMYLSYDENIKNSSIAIVREIGTKVEDKQVWNLNREPFNGVLIPKTSKADWLLKTIVSESAIEKTKEYKNIFDEQLTKFISDYIEKKKKDILASKYAEEILVKMSEKKEQIPEEKSDTESSKTETQVVKEHKKKKTIAKTYRGSYESYKKDELEKFSNWLRKNSYTENAIEKYVKQGIIIDLYCKQHYGVYFLEPKDIKELYKLREKLSENFPQEKSEIFMKNYYIFKATGNKNLENTYIQD